jgi:hypothetical protein
MKLFVNLSTLLCLCMALAVPESLALPNEYQTFKRTQSIEYQPNEDDLVRIWMYDVVK